MDIAREWDVICIGAGITSLAFGAMLIDKNPGVRVLVVDKHSVPGGYASWFKRPKVAARFDCSLHKLSGMAHGGNMRRILERMGIDVASHCHHPTEYFDAISRTRRVRLGNDPTTTMRALQSAFPAERAAIEAFFADVATHGKDGYFQFQMLKGEYEPDFARLRHAHRTLRKITVHQRFAELFRDDELKDILSSPSFYIGAFPEQINYLYFLHVVYATLHSGNAYFIGSAQGLSNYLTDRIRLGGGSVLLSNPALQVLTDGRDNRAVGVSTRTGVFQSSYIYINAAPKYALAALFPPLRELEPVKRKLDGLVNSNATTTLYLLTDVQPERVGLDTTESMIYGHGHEAAAMRRARTNGDVQDAEETYWRAGLMEVTNYHALDPAGGHVVVANVLDLLDHWPERRSPDYKAKKARAKAVLLQRLMATYPDLSGRLRYLEMSTPRTYLRYTNNTGGAGYGALVGTDLSSYGFHYDFPIKGVRFLSSWVAGGGYEAAFGYAEMLAEQWQDERRRAVAPPPREPDLGGRKGWKDAAERGRSPV
jgi:all-trans-retinol 13,14-reductase